MKGDKRSFALRALETIPGIGHKGAEVLWSVGIHSLADLRGKNPENLYARLCLSQKKHIDRCVLYQFRCAVYYASEKRHYPQLLKWWNWKD